MAMERRRRWIALILFLAACYFVYSHGSLPRSELWRTQTRKGPAGHTMNAVDKFDPMALGPANDTLGFGAILVVSRAASPRRESLVLAANITELALTIPAQPTWTDADLAALRAAQNSKISHGSALAWLGHLNALRWFLATTLETVLILEDDVDWDIHLRTAQIPMAAAAVRRLVAAQTDPPGSLKHTAAGTNYWGNSSAWDILYLGHCGDIFKPSAWTYHVPRVAYLDPTLPARTEMHPYTQAFLESIDVPEAVRLVHQSVFPLCTFAFALSRTAARRLLDDVAAREPDGGTPAYDVRVLEACRDLGFRCWSANPELFHHLDSASEIAHANAGKTDEGKDVAGADGTGRLQGLRAGKAPNIACGARSRDFFTRDPRTLEYLRQVVGREGKCLRDSM